MLKRRSILFSLAILCLMSNIAFAQSLPKIDLSLKGVTLKEFISAVESKTNYTFIYNNLDLTQAVSIEIKRGDLREILNKVLSAKKIAFEISGTRIIIDPNITKKKIPDNPQLQKKISGTVTDEKGMSLIGVSVRIKSAGSGTATDQNGNFTLMVPESATLVFFYTGYKQEEIVVAGKQQILVTLKEDHRILDEVVVVGYGVQKKSDLTGSISSIKGEELQQSKAISFMDAMQGRSAGVQVTSSSGEPGAATTVSIRGTNSFNSGTQPLYVIDGVQIDVNNAEAASSGLGNTSQTNPMAGINPSDIASIEILKDASATAIFGSRGANGVVIVTTKSGKSNTSVIELNTYAGVSWASRKIKMLGAQDYANYRFEADGPIDTVWSRDSNGDGLLDAPKNMAGVPSHDWQDEVLRKALSQSYNISFSGGSPKTTFYGSASYLNQQGLILNNKFERYGFNLKITHNATNRLRIGGNINVSQAIATGPASNGGDGVTNSNGLIQNFMLYKPVNVPDPGSLALDPDGSAFGSPVDFVTYAYKSSPLSRAIGDLVADYRIIDGLTLSVRSGGVLTYSSNKEFYPSNTSWGLAANGKAILNNSNSTNWYESNTLTYTKRFKQKHALTALVGFEANSYTSETFDMAGEGFDIQSINAVDNISSAKVLTKLPTTNKIKYNRVSQFGRLIYGYDDRYLFTATLRNDASSKLADNHKSALFPSGAFAWRMSNERFMRKQRLFSDIKFRTSFGITGNERIPPYQSLSTMSNVYYSASTGSATLGEAPSISGNSLLTWETTYQYDAGLDFSLLDDRVTVSTDVYLKKTKDLLLQADVSSQTGFMKQWQNLGQIDNKGLEFSLSTINLRNKNFTWSSNFNISFNRNKIINLGSVSYLPVNIKGGNISSVGRVIVGQPIGTGYGYVFDGIYQTSDFITTGTVNTLKPGVPSILGRTVRPGDLKFKDLNGDGRVDNTNDYTIISNSNPKHYGGFSNNLKYKNLELNVLLQWSYGNDILNTGRYRYQAGAGFFANLSQDFWTNRWTTSNPTNTVPALKGQGKTDISSYYVEDGSYMRLKNITLSYNLKGSKFLKTAGISGFRLYITAENLYTWTKYTGFDPEIASYSPLLPGIDNISYPRSKTITLGLTAKF
ncbi:TonB-linked SusC/RagA family outer membrane protein [Mucilaginibacter gracilis]|uniref:TonB-linked SusC/RagA family outer membrane protein n=1 Tax=Mucilaginibacter gracilis TaxID=423350 RepID=A0A495J6G7_9SPHI|nr:TonB-dependent receptor [Mucilaginibacter gracilis]RKR84018.1 TonB-linked SusC/RagA family outer membrane protein [Mucilaginibacter gracilis]